jgi:hypothetical protein
MSDGGFERAIFDHLALAERNRKLEPTMPLDQYRQLFDDGGRSTPRSSPPVPAPALDPAQDFDWDATKERPLPLFDRRVA